MQLMHGSELDPSDEKLMARLAKGDISALGPLYHQYGDHVLRFLLRFLGNATHHEADDLCQEVFLAAFKSASNYTEKGKLRSWLLGIAARKAMRYRRKNSLRQRLFSRYVQEKKHSQKAHSLSATLESSRLQILNAVNRLPKTLRAVVILKITEDMSGQEIAETLGISTAAVWTRFHRAQRILLGELLKE